MVERTVVFASGGSGNSERGELFKDPVRTAQ